MRAKLIFVYSVTMLLFGTGALYGNVKGTLDLESGWYPAGTNVTVTATPDPYYYVAWQGDKEGDYIDGNEFTFTVDGPRSVGAEFKPEVTETNSVPLWWLAQLDPDREDWTPEDFEAFASSPLVAGGMTIWEAYLTGQNPEDANARFEIGRVHIVDGKIRLEWSHAEGAPNLPQVYIEFRESLMDGDWSRVGDPLQVSDGPNTWAPENEEGAGLPGYYRLSVDIP